MSFDHFPSSHMWLGVVTSSFMFTHAVTIMIWVLEGGILKMVWDTPAHFYSAYWGGGADEVAL